MYNQSHVYLKLSQNPLRQKRSGLQLSIKLSNGLSELRPTVVDDVDGSASHPHKIARLATDSDSASASRPKPAPPKLGKPVQIQIIGDHSVCFGLKHIFSHTLLDREHFTTGRETACAASTLLPIYSDKAPWSR